MAEQSYGKVLGVTIRRVASMPKGWYSNGELSGGALLDLHIHDTDFIDYLLGKPAAVFSRGYSKTSGAVDHLVTHYLYEGPDAVPLVTAEGSWCLADGFGFQMKYTVNCERATLDYDLGRTPMLTVAANGTVETITLPNENGLPARAQVFCRLHRARRTAKCGEAR